MNIRQAHTTVGELLNLPRPLKESGHDFILAVMLASRSLSLKAREFLRESALTEAQFNVLMLLKYQFSDGASQSRLGRCMLVNRANMTGLIDRMERDGLVERRAVRNDRRANLVRITAAGGNRLEKAESPYFAGVRNIAESIPPGARKHVMQTLLALCRLVDPQ